MKDFTVGLALASDLDNPTIMDAISVASFSSESVVSGDQ